MRCSIDNGINTTGLTEVIEQIINVLTPTECYLCAAAGDAICFSCYESQLEQTVPCCYSCRARSDTFRTCPRCRATNICPKNLWAAVQFDGETKRLIYKMKFDSNRQIARLIANKLCDIVPHLHFDVITYLPTASSRVRKRGFDHSKLIAKTFAKQRGYKFATLLSRQGQARQLGASKAERKRQAVASYFAKPNINHGNVLVIDDVISSGASLEAATTVLRHSGVKNVYAAVFARR